MSVPPAQVFDVDLADVRRVSARALGSGSANLETSASADEYHFTVPAGGQRVLMNWWTPVGNSANAHESLTLIGPSGQTVWSVADALNTTPTMDLVLPEGDYVFRVAGVPSAMTGVLSGAYDFVLYGYGPELVQTFPVDLSTTGVERTLSNTTVPGSGLLETSESVDRYTFTVPANGAVVLTMTRDTNYSTGPHKWELVNSAGTVVDSGVFGATFSKTINNLSGSYTLNVFRNPVSTSPKAWGANYTLKLKRAA
jgi:hypothetical protein